MKRLFISPRENVSKSLNDIYFTYHSTCKQQKKSFWNESVYYEFSLEEVEHIESTTEELHNRSLDVVDYVVKNPDILNEFNIPSYAHSVICDSWKYNDPTLMGRFDLSFNNDTKEIKCLEYNADTPTLAIETALAQWFWLQDVFPGYDQYNSLHEKLIDGYSNLKTTIKGNTFYFTSVSFEEEDVRHIEYFMDLATQAGLQCSYIPIDRIGWNEIEKSFKDENEYPIKFLHKLYPWEWLLNEQFGKELIHNVACLEPLWKCILSNKMFLVYLHKLFPNHPNILYTSVDKPNSGKFVEKPILAREGQNIKIYSDNEIIKYTNGYYDDEKKIYQQYVDLNNFGNDIIIGSWIVGNTGAGMIIRETDNMIVTGEDAIIPHIIK